MLRRDILWMASALGGARLFGADAAYAAEIAEWRKKYDRDLRSEEGPLWLIGRHNVPEGRTEIGSDASNRIELPDRAPKRLGAIVRQGDRVTLDLAPGVVVNLNGKAKSGSFAIRTGAKPDSHDKLQLGDFEFVTGGVEGVYQFTVRDRQSPFVKQFHGTLWYPVNAAYRVQGAFTAYAQPKELKIPDTGGRARSRQAPGYVTFRLNGETMRLEPIALDGILFFLFKDRTSARETYGAGRYLDVELPKDGKVVMDFNKAYNPYCAVNPYSACPIPPKSNILPTRIEAGAKYSGDH
jgi:uncharacterized protein (DUF1684 family)